MPENREAPSSTGSADILSVIVLYRMRACDSAAFKTLLAAITGRDKDGIRVLLYDNTPGVSDPGPLPEGILYESAGHNGGLAAAYNHALGVAQKDHCPWLLLLDQDTSLPFDFFATLTTQVRHFGPDGNVAALVPIVRSGGVVISPKRVSAFGLKPLRGPLGGIHPEEITAINSGTVVRCDFVRSIGGFNRTYWLDYLDHWLFRKMYEAGKNVAVSECTLAHNLSVQDYRKNVSIERYRSILAGESAFMTTYKPKLQIQFYLLRLLARSVKLAIQGQPDLALLTLGIVAKIARNPSRSLERDSQ